MTRYNKVTTQTVQELQSIVGSKYVWTDPDKLATYAHDEVTDPHYTSPPEVVVLPRTAGEIAAIMKLANRDYIPVTPRGAGTGLASGAVPFYGGIVLSLERMNEILEVDTENLFLVTEPGVTTAAVQQAARAAGLFYPGDPCSGDSSTIGGNIATNAGGNKAVKYGTTRQQVHGLEVVTPQGDIVTFGGKLVKNATGYSLENLIIGSEGTLGIVTKIYLKLAPLAKNVMDLLAIFPDLTSAIRVVPKIMQAGITPSAVEFMDNASIKCCEEFLREKLPYSDRGYYIIIQVEAESEDMLDEYAGTIDELCSAHGALSVLVADPKQIWQARKAFAEADRARSLVFSMEDLVVPMSRIPEAVEKIAALGEKYGIAIHCAGHAGDGNIHANILKDDMRQEQWDALLPQLQEEIYAHIYALGGKLSGEHGIGYKRKRLLARFAQPAELNMMRAIKKALDPHLILNPGKIFDVE